MMRVETGLQCFLGKTQGSKLPEAMAHSEWVH